MIRSFANRETERSWVTGKTRRLPPDIVRRALRKLTAIDAATSLEALLVPKSNKLHELNEDRAGQWSVSINKQWRVCFRFVDADAHDVEVVDYH